MKIKVKVKATCPTHGALLMGLWEATKGDWYDIAANQTVFYDAPKVDSEGKVTYSARLVDLGLAIKLPKDFEAVVVPRSSLWFKKGVVQTNSFGVIDNSYGGDSDIWKFPMLALKEGHISIGEKMCQFKIQLSQKAGFMAKLRWLFSSGFKFELVDHLDCTNRGGFGSTGGYDEH